MEEGLPFLGMWISGLMAGSIVIALDIVGPLAFLYATWHRLSWAPMIAYTYMTIFILNSLVALFTVRESLGVMPIVIPVIVTVIFMLIIYCNRKYFIKS